MNVKSLGYLVVQSTDLAKWRDFGTNVCGMMEAPSMPASADKVYLKMDQRTFRYLIVPGQFDGLLYAGWQLENESAFNAALRELQEKGIVVETVEDAAELASRSASGLARLADPSGNRLELYWSQVDIDKVAFKSPLDVKGFVTTARTGEDMGLGHVVLHAPVDFEGTHQFYREMGFFDADITDMNAKGLGNIYFMNCNSRHHSLA